MLKTSKRRGNNSGRKNSVAGIKKAGFLIKNSLNIEIFKYRKQRKNTGIFSVIELPVLKAQGFEARMAKNRGVSKQRKINTKLIPKAVFLSVYRR
ncbi:MAG: hypothetical protein WC731_02100 [Candidatus Omnitrophota bacterium]